LYLNGGMRILVTGHRGNVGVPVARHLEQLGHEVVGFDRADGGDLLDLNQVRQAASGCAAVVHLAALPHDTAGSPEQIMAVNVLGTWHVLLAAEDAGAERVVYFSSSQVFGTAEGERQPDYFPVDDAHPRRAMRGPESRAWRCGRSGSGMPGSTSGTRSSGVPSQSRSGSRSGTTAPS
jgi:nucleoside-diphosphate-sugar epimerase